MKSPLMNLKQSRLQGKDAATGVLYTRRTAVQ